MRQVWITKVGPPDVLQVRDAPIPEPAPGQVRIKVAAAGVNFADIMGRLGLYRDAPPIPHVPGHEVAGTVDAVGPGVQAWHAGDEVFAAMGSGGYAEYVCVPAAQVLARPAEMPVEQAAGFPVVFIAAYEGLVALAGIKPGEHVLIQAAAGGLGLAAIEIAKIFDATIYGTASPGKHEFLRGRGVHHPIDYRHHDFEREIKRLTGGRGVQIALDSIGGRSWLKSYRALSPGGRLVISGVSSLAPGLRRSPWAMLRFALATPWFRFNPAALANDNKGVMGVNLGRLWGEMDMVRGWVDHLLAWYGEGRLAIHVDRVFPLEDAAAAHRYVQERRSIGKVILVTGR